MAKEQSVLVIPDRAKLKTKYDSSRKDYDAALSAFQSMVRRALAAKGLRPILKGRVKEFESYYAKKLRLLKKAWSAKIQPIPVNDILAIRVVCPFLGDLVVAEKALCENFNVVEIERKGAERSFWEFGYESIHVLVEVPEPLQDRCRHLERNVIEIQLRTILQEAWAEVEHELVYKAEFTPFDEPMKRKLAALNANLSLSDIIFQEILEYEKRLNSELASRRDAFYRKIEEVADIPENIDPGLAAARTAAGAEAVPSPADEPKSEQPHSPQVSREELNPNAFGTFGMDGLLLAALEAHNISDFQEAIRIYSEILSQKPEKEIAAIVYKHRGMAYFAQSKYHEALQDFSACLMLDPDCYKALYYRGVVKSVLDDLEGAVDDFGAALNIHPYHFFSRYRRALSQYRMGDYAQAIADCEIALRIEPDNNLAKQLFGKIRSRIGSGEF